MSVYENIIEQIKRDILLGIYAEGERLPSCREFAMKIGVNPNTVQRAYAELEEKGYVCSIPKKGVYVQGKAEASGESGLSKAAEALTALKRANISREQLLRIIDEVYKDD